MPISVVTIYRVTVYVLFPFILLGLVFKGFRNKAYWYRWSERCGSLPKGVDGLAPFDYWIHAVSVGEARAAVPLIRKVLKNNPALRIIITTTTPTGSNMVVSMLSDEVAKKQVSHCYMPYDVGIIMRRFIKETQVKAVIVMETEIWPNLIHHVKKAGAKLIYINVRLSERSYAKYAKLPSLVKATLSEVDHFAVQGTQDKKHLMKLGVVEGNITTTGSIKFDITVPSDLAESAKKLRQAMGVNRPVWVAGSTRDGEEEIIIPVYQELRKVFSDLLLVIVPRHPERFNSVAKLITKSGLSLLRRSQEGTQLNIDVDVYLGDTMGELSLMYAAADVAFVGGSLLPLGGQNILEPCAVGVPVLFGPHMFNFPDISKLMIKEGVGIMVQDSTELHNSLHELLSNKSQCKLIASKGLQFIQRHKGALNKNYELISELTRG